MENGSVVSRDVSGAAAVPRPAARSGDNIFRQYYTDTDFVLSPEGLLKLFAAIVCIVSSVLLLSRGTCSSAPALPQGGGYVSLAGAALAALLLALAVLRAPQLCLFTDIILSTVMGVLLLIMAVITMTTCEMRDPISYVHGPVGLVGASLLLGSAVVTYVSVMRRWDAASPRREPARPPPAEHDV